jgi:hypothetical protein
MMGLERESKKQRIDKEGIMLPVFPRQRKFQSRRNWAELSLSPNGEMLQLRLWVESAAGSEDAYPVEVEVASMQDQ